MQNVGLTKDEALAGSSRDKGIKILVGYGWQKFSEDDPKANGREVLHDTFWKSLKALFKPTSDGFRGKGDITASFGRLRASHGRQIWQCITHKIEEADLLIFDVAACPSEGVPQDGTVAFADMVTELNANVLLELGYALAKEKPVMLLCPKHLFDKVPSDLKGFLWTLYTCSIKTGSIERKFVDSYGALNAFRGMLREIAKNKIGDESDD